MLLVAMFAPCALKILLNCEFSPDIGLPLVGQTRALLSAATVCGVRGKEMCLAGLAA